MMIKYWRFELPEVLKSSSGGCTPVRQLKNRAAQRRKGSIPLFTLSATELPDTSGTSLVSPPQNNQVTQAEDTQAVSLTNRQVQFLLSFIIKHAGGKLTAWYIKLPTLPRCAKYATWKKMHGYNTRGNIEFFFFWSRADILHLSTHVTVTEISLFCLSTISNGGCTTFTFTMNVLQAGPVLTLVYHFQNEWEFNF